MLPGGGCGRCDCGTRCGAGLNSATASTRSSPGGSQNPIKRWTRRWKPTPSVCGRSLPESPRRTQTKPSSANRSGATPSTAALADAVIDATPEELTDHRASRRWRGAEAEMVRAAREMGLGDDGRAASGAGQGRPCRAGRAARVSFAISAREAIAYVREHDLVTVPLLAEETWRMEMMSAERQKSEPLLSGRRGDHRLVSDRSTWTKSASG